MEAKGVLILFQAQIEESLICLNSISLVKFKKENLQIPPFVCKVSWKFWGFHEMKEK